MKQKKLDMCIVATFDDFSVRGTDISDTWAQYKVAKQSSFRCVLFFFWFKFAVTYEKKKNLYYAKSHKKTLNPTATHQTL